MMDSGQAAMPTAGEVENFLGATAEPQHAETTGTTTEKTATGSAGGPAAETKSAEATPRTYRVKVDGEEIEIPETEAPDWIQRGLHYTRKMQEVSQQREALASREAELNARQAELEALRKALETRRAEAAEEGELDPEMEQMLRPVMSRLDKALAAVDQKLAALDAWRSEAAEAEAIAEAAEELQEIVDQVKEKFPDVDPLTVAAIARDRIPREANADDVRAIFFDIARAQNERIRRMVGDRVDGALKAKTSAPPAAAGSPAAAPPPAATAKVSMRDLRRVTDEFLRG